MPDPVRRSLVWGPWFITWVGLVAGLFDRVFYEYVVVFSAAHALLIHTLNRFSLKAFPVQVRIAFLAWVWVGAYVPYMTILMYITTVGTAANLFLGYCPLARMVYLLPWNREEAFSFGILARVAITPPSAGRFKPAAR